MRQQREGEEDGPGGRPWDTALPCTAVPGEGSGTCRGLVPKHMADVSGAGDVLFKASQTASRAIAFLLTPRKASPRL